MTEASSVGLGLYSGLFSGSAPSQSSEDGDSTTSSLRKLQRCKFATPILQSKENGPRAQL